jgi:hypothetical protein
MNRREGSPAVAGWVGHRQQHAGAWLLAAEGQDVAPRQQLIEVVSKNSLCFAPEFLHNCLCITSNKQSKY